MMWVSKVEIRVPVIGGMYDGAEALCKNLEPGKVLTLAWKGNSARYAIQWFKGQPRLVPAPPK